jgi:hypothetical protein
VPRRLESGDPHGPLGKILRMTGSYGRMGGRLASYGSCVREVAQRNEGGRAPKVAYGLWRTPPMVRSFISAALVVSPLTGAALAASIGGYTRQDGPYVQPHLRTTPNHHPSDTSGFPGQEAPNTGRTTPG